MSQFYFFVIVCTTLCFVVKGNENVDDLLDFNYNDVSGDTSDADNKITTVHTSLGTKEKRIRSALLLSTSDKKNRRLVSQLLPILRGLSRPQKMALVAIVSAQVDQKNGMDNLSIDEVERLFGEKRKLILPVILDIANVVHHALHDYETDERKYKTTKIRHRRRIEQTKFNEMPFSSVNETNENTRQKRVKRQRKLTDYFLYSHHSDILVPLNMSVSDEINNDDQLMNDHTRVNLDDFVHVTLPLYTNRTISREVYEDLALYELNGTDISDDFVDHNNLKYNESLPTPAMLLSHQYRIPIRSQPVQLNPKKCDLFDCLCLHADDYPMSQIMRSINRHKNAILALLAEHPTPVRKYFDQKRKMLLNNPIEINKRREDVKIIDDIASHGMCPSVVRYARPQKARSATGEWKYIVNTAQHTQTLRLEKCSNPENACNYLGRNFRTRCIQVHNYHRLLSWNNLRGLHVDIFKVPTCCSCQVDTFQEQMFNSSPITSNKYATILGEDDSKEDEEGEDEDNNANSSIADQYSNGFKKTSKIISVPIPSPMPMPMPLPKPTSNSSILTMKKMQSMIETVKNSPEIILNSYLKPPNNNEFNGEGSFKKRQRRPIRKQMREQVTTGSELDVGNPQTITLIDFFDRPLKRHASATILNNADKKISSTIPNISTATTSVNDLSKRVNYNYHPIIDFFSETVPN